jgi:hypothetical protein
VIEATPLMHVYVLAKYKDDRHAVALKVSLLRTSEAIDGPSLAFPPTKSIFVAALRVGYTVYRFMSVLSSFVTYVLSTPSV